MSSYVVSLATRIFRYVILAVDCRRLQFCTEVVFKVGGVSLKRSIKLLYHFFFQTLFNDNNSHVGLPIHPLSTVYSFAGSQAGQAAANPSVQHVSAGYTLSVRPSIADQHIEINNSHTDTYGQFRFRSDQPNPLICVVLFWGYCRGLWEKKNPCAHDKYTQTAVF